MLKTRVITAFVLLAVLLPTMYSKSIIAFAIISTLFFGAAVWENQKLFKKPGAILMSVIWALLFCYLVITKNNSTIQSEYVLLFSLCSLFWCLRLAPALALGLPALNTMSNAILSGIFSVCIFGCFIAMFSLFLHSPEYLLSSMALVWIADIGAYFTGKAIGKKKLAPSISPGKSWEGAIGGWISVLVIAWISTLTLGSADILPVKLMHSVGLIGFIAVLTILVVASVIGDLFESLLKRRAEVKDSSGLLPGHGGVLDRVDALIPVLPMVALFDFWFK